MAVDLKNFPLVNTIAGLSSFCRYIFQNPNLTPADWRWNSDEMKSKIIIRGGYGDEDLRPGSRPQIIIVRNSFGFSNSSLDNLESAKPNTFTDVKKRDWMIGTVDVICVSAAMNEADCLASWIALMIQEHRHVLRHEMNFLKQISYSMIGPSTPGSQQDKKIREWMTTLRINVELNLNWLTYDVEPIMWKQLHLYTRQNGNAFESDTGTVVKNSTLLTDENADFGVTIDHRDMFNEAELNNGWYMAFIGEMSTPFKIQEIVDSKTLRISYTDKNQDKNYDPAEDFAGKYKIVWNQIHFASTAAVE